MKSKKRRSREFKNNSRVIDIEEARRLRTEKRQQQRAREEEEQNAQTGRRVRRRRELRRKQAFRRLTIVAAALGLAFVMGISIMHIVSLKSEQSDILERQAQLQEEKQEMQEELNNVDSDESLEEQARSKLKLIKPGETIYVPEEDE